MHYYKLSVCLVMNRTAHFASADLGYYVPHTQVPVCHFGTCDACMSLLSDPCLSQLDVVSQNEEACEKESMDLRSPVSDGKKQVPRFLR